MKQLILVATMLFAGFGTAHADLWSQKAARDQAIQNQERTSRMVSEQQQLLSGLERLPSGLNFSTAQCSDGWDNGDFQNKVADVCNAQGCYGYYARNPSTSYGFIFTCNFYLNNGSQCHAEAFSSPRNGFTVDCVTTSLQDAPRKFIYIK